MEAFDTPREVSRDFRPTQLAETVLRAERDPESLTLLEQQKFLLFTSWRMGVWEEDFHPVDIGPP
jgi:hypothetical protein